MALPTRESSNTLCIAHNPHRSSTSSEKNWAPVNLNRIQEWINQGRLTSSPDSPITARELLLSGCINNVHDGVKVLGNVRSVPFLRYHCHSIYIV